MSSRGSDPCWESTSDVRAALAEGNTRLGYYLQTAYSSNPHTPRKASLAFGPKTANQNTNIRIVLWGSLVSS